MASRPTMGSRLLRRARGLAARARYHAGIGLLEPGPARLSGRFRHPLDIAGLAGVVERYRAAFPESACSELMAARRLTAHQFSFLGHSSSHGPLIDWSRDPVSGRNWPQSFSADIPYRGAARLGDIKLPWELNKHQYFFTLGKAAWLEQDPRYSLEIVRQIQHWRSANPCYSGIHWISALEAGTRVASWVLAFPFYAAACNNQFRDELAQLAAQHLLFVERNLSDGEYSNTHLAGEAAVLVVGALFLECAHSSRWLETGLHHLELELTRQVRPDGAHAEQSMAYHRFFLDQYFLANAFLVANGLQLSAAAYRQMERMTEHLCDMLFPDGSAPAFGDCDDARGIWCHAACPRDYLSLAALAAVLFDRGDFKAVARAPAEELLWLGGTVALDAFEKLRPSPPDHTSVHYPDAGYSVMRSGWDVGDSVMVVDSGPVGHGPSGHGHADSLSLQLFAAGYLFFADPGTYSYNLDYGLRRAFRGTRAHNTVTVDGVDQSVGHDRMSWSRLAATKTHKWITTPWFDLLEGSHEGYLRLSHPAVHRRVVLWVKPDCWLVCDRLEGSGCHDAEVLFHLLPDCAVDLHHSPPGATLRSPAGFALRVQAFDAGGGSLPIEALPAGGTADPMCWHSGQYGTRTPAPLLRVRRSGEGELTTLTLISVAGGPYSRASAAAGNICISGPTANGDLISLLMERDGGSRTSLPSGEIFRGTHMFRRRCAGRPEVVIAANCWRLHVPGVIEFEASAPVRSLQVIEGPADDRPMAPPPAGVRVETRAGFEVTIDDVRVQTLPFARR